MTFAGKLLVALAVAALAACGGGGGGGGEASVAAPQDTAPALQGTASLRYRATNLSGDAYDPWTTVRLEPTVIGVPATTPKAFRADNLPAGLAIDPSTGVITGRPDNVDAVGANVRITMTAQGYRGNVFADYPLRVNGLTWFESFGGGFTFDQRVLPTVNGTVGVPGTVTASVVMRTFQPDGGQLLGAALPAGATVVYGLTARSNVPGGTMDASTGVWSWTPTRAGTFLLEWQADVTYQGVTRRVIGQDLQVTIR